MSSKRSQPPVDAANTDWKRTNDDGGELTEAARLQIVAADAAMSPVRRARSPARCVPHPVHHLQRSLGNVGVAHLLPQPGLQPNLIVSAPDDAFEREAERVADLVMRMPAPSAVTAEGLSRLPRGSVARACGCHGSGHPCTECAEEEELRVHRAPAGGAIADTAGKVVADVLRSPGQPLDRPTCAFMEPRFGHDFGRVRIHTDGRAAATADAVGALAYTVGPHIVFSAAGYEPASPAGRKLLAHELTHVVQQDGPRAPQATIQRDAGTGHGTGAPTTTAPTCASRIADIREQALVRLDDAYSQLLSYEAGEVIPDAPGSPPDPEHERVGRTLERTFHTRDHWYASVLSQRLAHMTRALRGGGVTVTCAGPSDPGCRSAGSEFTVAYVARPYAMVMCGVPVVNDSNVATFVHELAHAVVPQVGVRGRLTSSERGVRDRAYRFERLFRHLSPEEALDNASSYEFLVEQLFGRLDADVATSEIDQPHGCRDPALVRESIARFELWNRDVLRWLHAVVDFLTVPPPARPFADLPPDARTRLTTHLPAITTIEGIRSLIVFYERMNRGLSISLDVACVRRAGACAGALAFGPTGAVDASAVALRHLSVVDVNLCPAWFDASAPDRIASLYALFIITRPTWMTADIALRDAPRYARLAAAASEEITPAPAAHSAMEHLLHDEPESTPRGRGDRGR